MNQTQFCPNRVAVCCGSLTIPKGFAKCHDRGKATSAVALREGVPNPPRATWEDCGALYFEQLVR